MNAISKKSEYVAIEAQWYEVPGRDENFKRQTIANTSEAQWRVEYECIDENALIEVEDQKTKQVLTMRIRDFYDFCCD
jgi:hypothetical protein